MAGLDILGNAARSMTGAVTKAFIRFEDERIKNGEIQVATVKARSGISFGKETSLAAKMAISLDLGFQSTIEGFTDLLSGRGDITSSGNVYQVKFNPSQISFDVFGGNPVQKMNMAGGTIDVKYAEMSPRIMLNVPLLFDDYERTDAFMMEKLTDPGALLRTGAVSALNTVTNTTYSVKPQVEGFIAALRNEKTRKMTFCWGNMAYRGMLESVNAEYKMFNMQGQPIRAMVTLGILLVDESVKDGDIGYWKKSYQKVFESDSSSLESGVQNVGNLFHIKL